MLLCEDLNHLLGLGGQIDVFQEIDLCEHYDKGLVLEERFDVLEQGDLLFNGVSFIEWVVEDTWGINNLPSCILVISVTDEKTLCSECIGLNIDVSISHVVHET